MRGLLLSLPRGVAEWPWEGQAVLFKRLQQRRASSIWFPAFNQRASPSATPNGRSPDYYLPETTGAGCAFFDYDNDGWMDIYLVNSGKIATSSTQPPLRNALYHNNRDGTFTDVTEKAGGPGWWLRHGRGHRRLQRRRLSRSLCHAIWPQHSLSE